MSIRISNFLLGSGRGAVGSWLRAGALALVALTAAALWQTGSADAQSRPNILFAIADDWGFGHAGVYGAKWVKTPHFDRVANEGALFTHCFTSNPKCSPCRASILTGRNTWQLEEATNHFGVFPKNWPVYTDMLEDAGYHVGYTGKGWGPGDYEAGGFTRNPAGPQYSKHRAKPPYQAMGSIDYARNFEDFLAARDGAKPFAFWFGTQEPHRAYEQGAGLRAGRDPSLVEVPKFYPDNSAIRSDMLDYALEVEWFDTHLGRILKAIEDAGELDNTLVVVTSDHGMPFPRVKGQIYEQGFKLPLAIRWGAEVAAGRTVEDFVNVRDFAPTFLKVAGVPVPATMTGRDLLDTLRSRESGWIDRSRNRMLVGKERHDIGRPNDWGYPVRAIRTPEWLYIRNYHPERWPAGNPETGYRNVDGSPTKDILTRSFDKWYNLSFGKRPAEELYRVEEDPDNVDNLADNSEFYRVKVELRKEMEEMLKAEGDPRMLGNADVFDTYYYTGRSTHSWESWMKNQENE